MSTLIGNVKCMYQAWNRTEGKRPFSDGGTGNPQLTLLGPVLPRSTSCQTDPLSFTFEPVKFWEGKMFL